MRADRPAVAERVLELAVAVAPELIGYGHRHLGAGFDRARDDRIDVVDVEVDGDRRALSAFGPSAPHSGISSTSITVESPMRTAACMSLPSGPGNRAFSVAPNAFL